MFNRHWISNLCFENADECRTNIKNKNAILNLRIESCRQKQKLYIEFTQEKGEKNGQRYYCQPLPKYLCHMCEAPKWNLRHQTFIFILNSLSIGVRQSFRPPQRATHNTKRHQLLGTKQMAVFLRPCPEEYGRRKSLQRIVSLTMCLWSESSTLQRLRVGLSRHELTQNNKRR